VSQENVETILTLLRAVGDEDFVVLFREDERWARFIEAAAPIFHPDFESSNILLGVETTGRGMEGLRAVWLDWLRPWTSYRTKAEKILDYGDRVAVTHSAFGRRPGSDGRVKLSGTFVFVLDAGKIVRCQGYPDRAEGLKAVGLEGQAVSENLDLVRSIYADWEHGDFSSAEWADPRIEYVLAEGPEPTTAIGLTAAARLLRATIGTWEHFEVAAQEIRELDDGRVLAMVRDKARGRTSGAEIRTDEAHVLDLRDGKVTRFVVYRDRAQALADLGLEE
jgi:ketosteroid isomerase-like protein